MADKNRTGHTFFLIFDMVTFEFALLASLPGSPRVKDDPPRARVILTPEGFSSRRVDEPRSTGGLVTLKLDMIDRGSAKAYLADHRGHLNAHDV